MGLLKKSGLKTQKPLQRGKPIPKRGSRSKAWEKCRNEMLAEAPKNEDGLTRCQDTKLGLPHCGVSREAKTMDLHHTKGRDGNLLTDKRWLVWLTRECHDKAHGKDTNYTNS